MTQADLLLDLARQFGILSVLTVGGINSTLPEIERVVVEVHGWMSGAEFRQLFALSQAAPGPNFLIVSLIGYYVSGFAGALVATIAVCSPSSVLAYWVAGAWHRFRDRPWRRAIQSGIAPMTVGLIFASGAVLAPPTDGSLEALAITAVTVALVLTTRVHPALIVAAAALLGVVGLQ